MLGVPPALGGFAVPSQWDTNGASGVGLARRGLVAAGRIRWAGGFDSRSRQWLSGCRPTARREARWVAVVSGVASVGAKTMGKDRCTRCAPGITTLRLEGAQ